jgi:hypothetical protein
LIIRHNNGERTRTPTAGIIINGWKNKSMKTILISLTLFVVTFLLYSCGGVIGNIEKYRFTNVSIDSLKSAVARVYTNHPEFKNFDSTKFKEGVNIGDANYYCRIKDNHQDYFFKYAYPQYPPPNDTIVEIALTSGARYGADLDLARDISVAEKNKYRSIFEKYFISEVRKELKK